MKLKTVLGILFVFGMFSPALSARNFRCGFLNSRIVDTTLSIPRPPDFRIAERNVQVVITEIPRVLRAYGNGMRQEFERTLAASFTIDNNSPEVVFKVFIDSFTPDIKRYKKTERRRVVVGQDCKTDKNGKESCTDKYEQRDVPVEYWEASVKMNWRVEVMNSSGTLVDSVLNTVESYESKIELSVNGKPVSGSSSSSEAGSSTSLLGAIGAIFAAGPANSETNPVPGEQEIMNLLITSAVKKFAVRYNKTYEDVTLSLACDDELSIGNKLVEDSNNARYKDWQGALNSWESTKMKRADTEGDRLFNMAVAYVGLALRDFDVSRLEDADSKLDKASELHRQATTLDPQEKYMQNFVELHRRSQNNLGRAKLHVMFAEQDRKILEQETRSAQVAAEARREAMKRPAAEDIDEEKNFRAYVRASLSNQEVVSDEDQKRLVDSYGQEMFDLYEDEAWRVVDQEMERKNNIDKYKKEFEVFIKDGVITKADRSALDVLAKRFSLTDEDVRTVESSYRFRDETRETPGTKRK